MLSAAKIKANLFSGFLKKGGRKGIRWMTEATRGHVPEAVGSETKEIPSKADIVILGGGSLGASIAYHLVERGLDVVLLERNKLTAGTTWHSAGMLWCLRPSDADIEMQAYTKAMCISLEKETEIQSWTQNGGLFIACNKERLNEYKRLREIGQYYNIESHVLAPNEINDIYPILNTEGTYGAIYSPGDGTIDPTNIVMAYAKAAKSKGARIIEGVGGHTIETVKTGKLPTATAVITEDGQRIETKVVINAMGVWSNNLHIDIPDTKLPIRALKHAFVVTESMPGVHAALPNVRDHDKSIYIKTQGDALALGGYEPNPEFWPTVDPNFAFGLFELDWETFGKNLEGHLELCPQIEQAGIRSTVCGPEGFTPDHKPLVGPHPKLDGYFVACGMNSMGMMLGGGLGREIATWVCDGSPNLDIFSYDISRFHADTVRDDRWIEDRTHESYAKTYAIVFPRDEPLAGRNARRSPLHDVLLEKGCVFQERHGFERPGWFEDIKCSVSPYDYYGAYEDSEVSGLGRKAVSRHLNYTYHDKINQECTFDWPGSFSRVALEVKGAREGVAVFDQSYFGKFVVTGPESRKALEYVSTARVNPSHCPPGKVTYTCWCNTKGGVEADLTITNLPGNGMLEGVNSSPEHPAFYIAAGGLTCTHNLRWLSTIIHEQGFDCEVKDISANLAMISVQGPYSRTLLGDVFEEGEEILSDLNFSHAAYLTVEGIQCLVLRLTFVGELGYELHVPESHAVKVYNKIFSMGESLKKKNIPVVDAGYGAIDSMSAEKGYRHWHADVSNAVTPMEANIGMGTFRPDNFGKKKEFVGRSALQAQRAEGLKRKLICLVIDDDKPLHGLETIWRNGDCVGYVKSTAYGHTIGKTIAYGFVECSKSSDPPRKITNKWLQKGTYFIGDKGERLPAKLSLKCPYDPSNKKLMI